MTNSSDIQPSTNLVVLRGTVTNDPTSRELANGTVVVQFDVTTRLPRSNCGTNVPVGSMPASVSVPVSWTDPTPAALAPIERNRDVVVIGTVRRRFFRSGGSTQSRTEVVADRVVPASRSKTVRSLIAAAASLLTE